MPGHTSGLPAPRASRTLIAAQVSMYFTQAEESLWDTLAARLGIPPADAIHLCALWGAAEGFGRDGDRGLAALMRARFQDVAGELDIHPTVLPPLGEETDDLPHPDHPGAIISTPRLPDPPAPSVMLKRVFDGKVRRGRLTRAEADAEMARLGFRPDGTPIAQPLAVSNQLSADG